MKQMQTATEKYLCSFLLLLATLSMLQGCQTAAVKQSSTQTQTTQTTQSTRKYVATPESQAKVTTTESDATRMPTTAKSAAPAMTASSATKSVAPSSVRPATQKSSKVVRNNAISEPGSAKSSADIKKATSKSMSTRQAVNTASNKTSPGQATSKVSEAKQAQLTRTKPTSSTSIAKPTSAASKGTMDKPASSQVVSAKQPANAESVTDKPTTEKQQQIAGKTEAIQIALAEPPLKDGPASIKEAVATKMPAIKLTADMLPYDFGGWTLERNWDNQHPQICRLRSIKTNIYDGYESTYLWAEILPNEINIYTGSNIDLEYEGSGLQFGVKPVQTFSGLLNETSVSVAGDFRDSLMASDSLTVYLGFWPTWPKTEIQKVSLASQKLLQALPVFEECQNWSE